MPDRKGRTEGGDREALLTSFLCVFRILSVNFAVKKVPLQFCMMLYHLVIRKGKRRTDAK